MSYKSIEFYSKVVDVLEDRDVWIYSVYLDLKKAFDKWELYVKTESYWWTEREQTGMDKRLSEMPKEKDGAGQEDRMEGGNRWSVPVFGARASCVVKRRE